MKHLLTTAATALILTTGAFAADESIDSNAGRDAGALETQTETELDGNAGTNATEDSAMDADNLSTQTTASGDNENVIIKELNPTEASKAMDGENLNGVMERSLAYDDIRTPFNAPAFTVDGFAATEVEMAELEGAPVYGASGEEIGEVENAYSMNGDVKRIIIGVGGFLGLGEKNVNVHDEEFTILKSAETGEVRVYVNASQEELENQPAFEG